jgi:hypothetical protein
MEYPEDGSDESEEEEVKDDEDRQMHEYSGLKRICKTTKFDS